MAGALAVECRRPLAGVATLVFNEFFHFSGCWLWLEG
jgi:hypothetical protein